MSTRRGLQVVAALIALVILGAVLDARWQQPVRCVDGYCIVPIQTLRELTNQAARADSYAEMCNWPKR